MILDIEHPSSFFQHFLKKEAIETETKTTRRPKKLLKFDLFRKSHCDSNVR